MSTRLFAHVQPLTPRRSAVVFLALKIIIGRSVLLDRRIDLFLGQITVHRMPRGELSFHVLPRYVVRYECRISVKTAQLS